MGLKAFGSDALFALFLFLIFVLLLPGCQPSQQAPSSSEQIPTPTPAKPVMLKMPRLQITTDLNQAYYYQGQPVEINFIFQNIGNQTIEFETFPPAVTISQYIAINYSVPVRKFPGGTVNKALLPWGETTAFTIVWDQLDEKGQQVPLSYYSVSLDDLNTSEKIDEVALYESGRLLIGPEDSMLDKTLYLNESKTVNSIKFTLEKVEFTPFGTTIYVIYLPIHYFPNSPTEIYAFYRIDDNVTQGAGKAKIDWLINGMRFTWNKLEPVYKDAKYYTFSITGFNYNHENWSDPWEFSFSLR